MLDGYPRTVEQAEYLDQLLAARNLSSPVVIHLDVPADVLVGRMVSRRQCSKCGQMYNILSKRPKMTVVCDDDGAPLVMRKDDREEVIRERLRTYEEVTRPVLNHYPSDRYFQISGDRSSPYIFEEITRHSGIGDGARMKKPEDLRSFRWFGPDTPARLRPSLAAEAARLPAGGFHRPPGHRHRQYLERNQSLPSAPARARGIGQARRVAGGRFPVEIPAFSITEMYMKPSPMLYRNLLAMETEEALRSLPIDGAVLMGGCDKTTPGLLMGAISMDLPAIYLPAGPMLRGNWNGQPLGSGTDCLEILDRAMRRQHHRRRLARHRKRHRALARILHDDGNRVHHDRARGSARHDAARRVVDSRGRFESRPHGDELRRADRRDGVGGSQAVAAFSRVNRSRTRSRSIWRSAARRTRSFISSRWRGAAGCSWICPLFDEISRRVPVLADIRPSGRFLMEDFFYAGGLRALMREIRDLLHLDCRTVNGKTLGENLDRRGSINPEVIRPRANPLFASGGTTVLYGNLAPDGAVIKTSAADPKLLKHTGPAVVFKDYNDMDARINRDDLDVTAGLRARAAERRPAGRSRDAGMGDAADPEEAARRRACATWCGFPMRA